MKKKFNFYAAALSMLLLTSCNAAVWEGIAAGMNNASNAMMYGGMGSAYNMGGSTLYGGVSVPYALQPDVAVEQATKVINNNVAAQMRADAEETQRIQKNMQNQFSNFWDNVTVVPDVSGGIVAAPGYNDNGVLVSSPSTNDKSASTYDNNSRQPTTSPCYLCHGYKKCTTCNGNRVYRPGASMNYVKCPNCTDGLCHACHGTGRTSPHYY